MGTPAGRGRPRPGHSAREHQAQDLTTNPAIEPDSEDGAGSDLLDPLRSFREAPEPLPQAAAGETTGPETTATAEPAEAQDQAAEHPVHGGSESGAKGPQADTASPAEGEPDGQWRVPDDFTPMIHWSLR